MASTALEAVRKGTSFAPDVGLLLGSGLDAVAAGVEVEWEAAYGELPGFPRSTVPGHAGRLVLGRLEGRRVCVLAGRFHLYEGYVPEQVAAGVRLLDGLGASVLLATNAAGSLSRRMGPGTLLLVADHVSFLPRTGIECAEGRHPAARGARAESPYDAELRRRLREAASVARIPLAEGIYAAVQGPSYETPAEIAFLRRCGADAVGMSTVPEVLAARGLGLRVAAVSCLTNYAAGLSRARLSHAEVTTAAARAVPRLEALLRAFLRARRA